MCEAIRTGDRAQRSYVRCIRCRGCVAELSKGRLVHCNACLRGACVVFTHSALGVRVAHCTARYSAVVGCRARVRGIGSGAWYSGARCAGDVTAVLYVLSIITATDCERRRTGHNVPWKTSIEARRCGVIWQDRQHDAKQIEAV